MSESSNFRTEKVRGGCSLLWGRHRLRLAQRRREQQPRRGHETALICRYSRSGPSCEQVADLSAGSPQLRDLGGNQPVLAVRGVGVTKGRILRLVAQPLHQVSLVRT